MDAIVEAGSRLLDREGWDGLSLQAVARDAGVSPGSLYQYFPDKASLVTEIIERVSQRELAFHLERFSKLTAQPALDDTLRAMIRSVVDFQRQEGHLMRHALAALQHLGRYEQLAERGRQAAVILWQVLEGHADALAPLEPRVAAHILTNAIHSLTHDGLLPRPEFLDDDTLVRELERLALGYLHRAS